MKTVHAMVNLCLALCLCASGGCTSWMKVEVSVLDKTKLPPLVPATQKSNNSGATTAPSASTPNLTASRSDLIYQLWGLRTLKADLSNPNWSEISKLDNLIIRLKKSGQQPLSYEDGEIIKNTIPQSVQGAGTTQIATPDDKKAEEIKAKVQQINAKVEQVVINETAMSDDRLATIVGAKDDAWKACYNKVFAMGMIGNSDIAIKMESPGNYTIKGVRLDADAATKATFSTTRQLLKIVAAGYGIPINFQNGDKTVSDAKYSLSEELSGISTQASLNRQAARSSKSAVEAVLRTITADAGNLGDVATREAAIERIRAAINANSGRMKGE